MREYERGSVRRRGTRCRRAVALVGGRPSRVRGYMQDHGKSVEVGDAVLKRRCNDRSEIRTTHNHVHVEPSSTLVSSSNQTIHVSYYTRTESGVGVFMSVR